MVIGWMVLGSAVTLIVLAALGWHSGRVEADRRCAADVAKVQSMIDQQRAKGLLDHDHEAAAQHGLATMQQACAKHDVRKAEAYAMNIVMFLEFASDDASVRKESPDSTTPAPPASNGAGSAQ